jgi:hypothetical protein
VEKTRGFPSPARTAVRSAGTLSVPMIRLFDQRDIAFLRAMPGYSVRMETAFRRRRCRIFRAYLRGLEAEFLSARTDLETLQIEFPEDYRHLSATLLRCRMRFAWALIPAYLCLFRYRWKLGTAGLAPVVQRLEGIRGEVRRSIPALS